MARKRRPVRKTQKSLSQEQVKGKDERLSDIQEIGKKRANAIKSEEKVFSITFEDHDAAIEYYLKEKINPTLNINGNQTAVPIMYASPERWKSIQKDGYLRDQDGKIMYPLITYRKLNFEKLRYTSKMDANGPANYYVTELTTNEKNYFSKYIGTDAVQNRNTIPKYKITVVPDYIRINYSIRVFADYVSHMNHLQEIITYASDTYWGEKEKFQFKTNVKGVGTVHEVPIGEERLLTSDIDLEVYGYILPEASIRETTHSNIQYGKSKIHVSVESELTGKMLEEFQEKIRNGSI